MWCWCGGCAGVGRWWQCLCSVAPRVLSDADETTTRCCCGRPLLCTTTAACRWCRAVLPRRCRGDGWLLPAVREGCLLSSVRVGWLCRCCCCCCCCCCCVVRWIVAFGRSLARLHTSDALACWRASRFTSDPSRTRLSHFPVHHCPTLASSLYLVPPTSLSSLQPPTVLTFGVAPSLLIHRLDG